MGMLQRCGLIRGIGASVESYFGGSRRRGCNRVRSCSGQVLLGLLFSCLAVLVCAAPAVAVTTITMDGTLGADITDGLVVDGEVYVVTGDHTVSATADGDAYALTLQNMARIWVEGPVEAYSANGSAYAVLAKKDTGLIMNPEASFVGLIKGEADGSHAPGLVIYSASNGAGIGVVGDWAMVGIYTNTVFSSATNAVVSEFELFDKSMACQKGARIQAGLLTTLSGSTLQLPAVGPAGQTLSVSHLTPSYSWQSYNATSTGVATINGNISIDPVDNYVGDSVVMSADSYVWGADSSIVSANPDFTVTADKVASGNLVVNMAYTPKSDATSLAMVSSMASVQSFAEVAQSRALGMLGVGNNMLSAENEQDREPVMVADASGNLAGLLDEPKEKPLWGIYVEPVHSFGHRAGSAQSEGYDSRMTGLEIGMDRRFGKHFLAGGFVGYGMGGIDFNGSNFYGQNSEDQYLYTAGLYGGYRTGDWIFTDTLSTTYAEHDMQRYASATSVANAHYFSWLTHNELLATYNWVPAENWIISPHGGINVTHIHQDAFTERNVTNGIHYNDLDKTFADATLGVRATRKWMVRGVSVEPYLGAGLIHSLGNGDVTVRQYLSTTSAQVTTQNDDDRFAPEAGITLRPDDDTSFTLGYTAEFGDTSQSQSIMGLLRWEF